jgi:hypothetical protein
MRESGSDGVQVVEPRLRARGYHVVSERHDDASFGDAEVTFERGATVVRVVRDRGQWFVEATAKGWSEWFAPTIWRALLSGSMPPLDAVPFDGQAQSLFDDLHRIESVTEAASDTDLDQLHDWRARRAEARQALPPESGT